MDELRDRIAQALSVPDVHHPDLCDCGQPVCGGTCYAEGEDCYCAAERCDGLEQQIDAVLALLQPIRNALANHPRCEEHPGGDVISCGWKAAVLDVQRALEARDG